ncbi:unnamed protein product [Mytilus edulis]|uniref:Uncharacterized protein n=1 Tax=Mytilus edulis TaxID=6550 RepID=A0A8S3RHN0_MYTED|nr:unnamed protein product [Mytilus edulis]
MFGPGWVEMGKCCNSRPCCVEFQCGEIPQIPNGKVTKTGTSIGSTANFSCDTGYGLRGNQSTTCTGDGWGYLPICVVRCEDIPQFPNGNVTKTGTSIGSTAIFSCSIGYELRGRQSITCTGHGWSHYPPICYACPDSTVHFKRSTYKFRCGSTDTWIQAEADCNWQGGNLTSIETEEENNYLKYVAKLISGYWWIGLSDIKTEGLFQWTSSQQLTFTDWSQGPPIQPDDKSSTGLESNADCVLLNPSFSYQWTDDVCHSVDPKAICEIWSVFSF